MHTHAPEPCDTFFFGKVSSSQCTVYLAGENDAAIAERLAQEPAKKRQKSAREALSRKLWQAMRRADAA